MKVDPKRLARLPHGETGILVRAEAPDGTVGSVDMAALDADSLLTWLRSRGGANPWAENIVGTLLGHGELGHRAVQKLAIPRTTPGRQKLTDLCEAAAKRVQAEMGVHGVFVIAIIEEGSDRYAANGRAGVEKIDMADVLGQFHAAELAATPPGLVKSS